MTTEEYCVGYDEGYQAGWNAAIDSPPIKTEQEPIAWMTNSEQDTTAEYMFSHVQTPMHKIPLYEAPPNKEWVGLSDVDLRQIILAAVGLAEAKLKVRNK